MPMVKVKLALDEDVEKMSGQVFIAKSDSTTVRGAKQAKYIFVIALIVLLIIALA